MRKKLRQTGVSNKVRMWDALPWKAVDVEKENLGDFEDSVFFGLEEIDGNAYKLSKGDSSDVLPVPVDSDDIEGEKLVDVSEKTVKPKKEKKKKTKTLSEETVTMDEETAPESIPKSEKKRSAKDDEIDVPKKKSKKTKTKELHEISEVADLVDDTMRVDEEDVADSGELGNIKSLLINAPAPLLAEDVKFLKKNTEWAPGLQLSDILSQALQNLGFATPTPIQTTAIPLTTIGTTDIVGAAETGSGKTLAFTLPIIHSLLQNWEQCNNLRIPHALIIAPTRELALQISTVMREVCTAVQLLCDKYHQNTPVDATVDENNTTASTTGNIVKLSKKAQKQLKKKGNASKKTSTATQVRIEIVSIVGGMSEHKQKRQLAGRGKPVHVVVATPGRLCEMFEDAECVSFQDMSRLRFLVVDEADRIMEDGHYPELHRVFSRIRDHEEIAESGRDPLTVLRARRTGTFEDDAGNIIPTEEGGDQDSGNAGGDGGDEEMIEDLEAGEVAVSMMPSEEELAAMRAEVAALGAEAYYADAHLADLDGAEAGEETGLLSTDRNSNVGRRQTLLYSATAIHAHSAASAIFDSKKKQSKKLKLKGTLKGVNNGVSLPEHLKQLLSQVGIQKSIHVVDVTASGMKKSPTATSTTTSSTAAGADGSSKGVENKGVHSMPAGLTQQELHVPSDEKDIYAYYYINKYPGRTLVFVNSIKTARRLDGLLRALGINCRALHAQLQQKQRLRALESFSDLPVGVLVATDVAARGLDISKIQHVLHYDAARSPQVYVHRSGRTARANQTGTSVSLVSPEDATHHNAICAYLGSKALPLLQVDLYALPMLRQRVALAKKIFVESFIASQKSKDQHWLAQSAKDADLEIDEMMLQDLQGDAEDDAWEEDEDLRVDEAQKEAISKKAIAAAKAQLQNLLDAPLPDARTFNAMQKKRARTENRGGRYTDTTNNSTTAGIGKPGKKGWKKNITPVVDNNWKRRSSFFVFAK